MSTSRSMQFAVGLCAFFIAGAAVSACTVRNNTRDAGGGGGETDAYVPPGTDANFNVEAGPVNPCEGGCGAEELCGDGEGNGLDDDCDLTVDEGCTCRPGTTRDCFVGPPDRRNVGACSDGVMSCNEFAVWDPCGSGVFPANEVCDGADNDCDGTADNGLSGCASSVQCPGNEIAAPLSNHTLDSGRVVLTGGASATSWHWTIDCPDSVPAALCPALATPDSPTTDVYFTASGAYRVSITMTLSDGSTANCAWSVYVRGGEGSLRVELNWDTMTDSNGTDVDLHLHRWTQNGTDTNWFTDDDCFYGNCQADSGASGPTLDWGMANSDLMNCQDAPHGSGAQWRSIGHCSNPRLDVDTNGTDGSCSASETNPDVEAFCAPENINIDTPVVGQPYRIMVNYYSDHGNTAPTNAWVNIYCGGAIRASYGRDAPFFQFQSGDGSLGGFGGGPENASWIVADVVFYQSDCGLDCIVYPIDAEPRRDLGVDTSGFGFGATEQTFGPPWSCNYDRAGNTCVER
ncbi:MAG: hypothetical protein U0353_29625 [Sandaracinus sp.]